MKAMAVVISVAVLVLAGCGGDGSTVADGPDMRDDSDPNDSSDEGSSSGGGSGSNSGGGGGSRGGGSSNNSAEVNDDEDSSLACDHFRNVANDASQGMLTDNELRKKLIEVYDNASIATADVRRAAQKMVQAITSSGYDSLSTSVGQMDRACSAAGH